MSVPAVPTPPVVCSAQRSSNESVMITWVPSSLWIGSDVQWIVIESVSHTPTDPVRSASANAITQTSYLITDLNPLSIYTFRVYAVSTLGYSEPFITNQVTLFQPSILPGCMLWLDAKDASTVLQTSEGIVSMWLDKSGCERNAIGNGQLYTGSSIQFTKNSMKIHCPALPQQTILMVAKPSSSESTKYIYNTVNSSSVPSIISNYTDSWVEYFNGIDRATFTQSPSACFMAAFAYSQEHQVVGYYNSQIPVFTIPQMQINTVPVSYSHIGSDQSIDAQICEWIHIDGILSPNDWTLLVSYLQQKWCF